LQRKQPKQTNVFVVLDGKNGPAKQEQQKRLNTGQPNFSSLVFLHYVTSKFLKNLGTPIPSLIESEKFGFILLLAKLKLGESWVDFSMGKGSPFL